MKKTLRLTLRENGLDGRYWCTTERGYTTFWRGLPLVCKELGRLAGFPTGAKEGDRVSVVVSGTKFADSLEVTLEYALWSIRGRTYVSTSAVRGLHRDLGLPSTFYVRVLPSAAPRRRRPARARKAASVARGAK